MTKGRHDPDRITIYAFGGWGAGEMAPVQEHIF